MKQEIERKFNWNAAYIVGGVGWLGAYGLLSHVAAVPDIITDLQQNFAVVGVVFCAAAIGCVIGFFGGWAFPKWYVDCPERRR